MSGTQRVAKSAFKGRRNPHRFLPVRVAASQSHPTQSHTELHIEQPPCHALAPIPSSRTTALTTYTPTGSIGPSLRATELRLPSQRPPVSVRLSRGPTPKVPNVPTTSVPDTPRDPVPPFNRPFASWKEERHVITILHAINLYGSDTIPSVKVKHLQQLSYTSFQIHEFKFDKRFLKLLKTIHCDVLPVAGPKQLQVISASYARLNVKVLKSWQAVLKRTAIQARQNLLTRGPPRYCKLRGPDICLILCNVADVGVRPYKALNTLFEHLRRVSTELFPIDIERALYAVRRLHLSPVNPMDPNQADRLATLKTFCLRVKRYIRETPPVVTVNIIRHLSALSQIPIGFLPQAEKHLLLGIDRLSPTSLASLALSYRTMRLWQPSMLSGITKAVLSKLTKTDPNTLSIALSALVQQGIRTKTFLDPVCQYIATWEVNVPNLSNKSLGFIAAALGESGCRVLRTWSRLSSIVQSRLEDLSLNDVSKFIHSLAVVGFRDRHALNLILIRLTQLVDMMDAETSISTLDSLALLGYYDQTLVTSLIARYCRLDPVVTVAQQFRLRRAMVALVLEAPDIIESLPRSSQLTVERNQQPFQIQCRRSYSIQLAECLKHLNLEFQINTSQGPLSMDALIIKRRNQGGREKRRMEKEDVDFTTTSLSISTDQQLTEKKKIGLCLMGPQHFCPISSQLLGHSRLIARLSKLLQIETVPINRLQWCNLPSEEDRLSYLRNALRHVL